MRGKYYSVIASEAKQSSVVQRDTGLPRRFAHRNDDIGGFNAAIL
jgi:hypothetical protein